MVNTIAIILIVYSINQIFLGFATLVGRFDPLLPKERKKLPAKARKKACFLNGISMIIASIILCLLGIGMLTSLDILVIISAVLMAAFIAIMSVISLKTEGKYLKKSS